MSEPLNNVKIVTIGDPFVGKTSLRRTFIGENFRKNYIETIGADFSLKNLTTNSENLLISLWDLAGQQKFLKIHPLFYKGAYGCIVVYSIVDRDSFEAIDNWIERFLELSNREGVPIMIIGNKIDLELENSEELITEDEEENLVEELKSKYSNHDIISMRTSAKTGKNVGKGFQKFANLVVDWIKNQIDDGRQIKFEDDLEKNVPGAYLFVMNEMLGPQLIGFHPPVEYDSKEYTPIANSGVKLIASLDFNDITFNSSLLSSFPITQPPGIYHYIAFIIENEKARGGRELYILGVNISRELNEPVAGIRGVINGFLHHSMNLLNEYLQKFDWNFATKKISPEDFNSEKRIVEMLKNLRIKTHESIKRWYNIPG